MNENVSYENNERKADSIYSKRLRAGKRRTYFFDVRATRGNDYFLTITESRKRFDDNGYDRHKIFLYKEDFNKFVKALGEAVDYVKTELMPDFDFDAFNREEFSEEEGGQLVRLVLNLRVLPPKSLELGTMWTNGDQRLSDIKKCPPGIFFYPKRLFLPEPKSAE